MTLNRGEKTPGARRLAEAITCAPTGIQKQLTEEEVYSQLAVAYERHCHPRRTQRKSEVVLYLDPSSRAPSLSTSVTEDLDIECGMVDRFPRLAVQSIRSQTGQPFRLLGGEQGSLRNLDIRNATCLFDPTPFTPPASLSLAAGVYQKHQDALDFLANSTQLKERRLVDVTFIDGAPHQLAERLVLPHLKWLVLVDRVETIGIANLYHSIRADNCENLNLVVRGVQEMWDPKLVKSIAPVVQKTFEAENRTTLRVGRFQRLNAASWEGASAMYKFRLGIIGDAQAQALALPDFINRVLSLAGGSTEVKLAIEDMLSGTARGCIAFDDVEAIPILFPHYFQTLAVLEVVDGYPRYLQNFVAPDLRKGFPALRSITLQAIPSEEGAPPPASAFRCRLEDFIDAVSQAYYGVTPGKQAPTEKRNSMTVVLEGTFGVNASTLKALVGGGEGERAGVSIVASKAKLHCINLLMYDVELSERMER